MTLDFARAHATLLLELSGVLAALAVVILIGGLLLARFDRLPMRDALYFAFITAMTVGFGDLAPRSGMARLVTIVLAFIGLLLFGILVAVSVHAIEAALVA